jgi:hypothetical protein
MMAEAGLGLGLALFGAVGLGFGAEGLVQSVVGEGLMVMTDPSDLVWFRARHAMGGAVPGLLAGGLLLAAHLRARAPAPAPLAVALLALPYLCMALGAAWLWFGYGSLASSELEFEPVFSLSGTRLYQPGLKCAVLSSLMARVGLLVFRKPNRASERG